jgi:hypothetical protein
LKGSLRERERERVLVACRLAGPSALEATMTASMRDGNPAKRTAFAALADRLDALAA